MNRLTFLYGITALAFLLLSTSGYRPPRWAQTDLGKRVSIDVNTVSPQEVFGSIASSLDCEFSVDSAVQQPVTLRVVNVTAPHGLECDLREHWLSVSTRRQEAGHRTAPANNE